MEGSIVPRRSVATSRLGGARDWVDEVDAGIRMTGGDR